MVTGRGPGHAAALRITTATRAQVAEIIRWAAAEGWNPGRADMAAFLAADPGGFLAGTIDGELAASISLVRYSPGFGFLGCYIVRPELRGRGHGLAMWRAAMARAGRRTVGLDGVPAQQANYARSGFVPARRNVRYTGTVDPGVDRRAGDGSRVRTVDLRSIDGDVLRRYDRGVFPAPRTAFLREWLAPPERVGRGALRSDGALAGYGVIRPAEEGRRIGPLFADDPEVGERLLLELAATAEGPLAIDVPEPNRAAARLVEGLGFTPSFETARMYAGPPPVEPVDRIFGVTTFELG